MLKDITLGQFFPGNSLVHKLDPRTKLLAGVLYIVALFLADFFLTYAIMFSVLALSIAISRVPLRSIFRGLKPVSYKLINGTSGRTHTGFIAQDVEEAMRAAGLTNMDFAGFCQDQKTEQVQKTKTVSATDPESGQEILEEMPYTEDVSVENEYVYSLRYEEFIALNTAMIQQLMKKSEEQKAVIAGLKDRISALEQRV